MEVINPLRLKKLQGIYYYQKKPQAAPAAHLGDGRLRYVKGLYFSRILHTYFNSWFNIKYGIIALEGLIFHFEKSAFIVFMSIFIWSFLLLGHVGGALKRRSVNSNSLIKRKRQGAFSRILRKLR